MIWRIVTATFSLLLPGLGQLLQGRVGAGIGHFFAAVLLWVVTMGLLGWLVHVGSAIDAAMGGVTSKRDYANITIVNSQCK